MLIVRQKIITAMRFPKDIITRLYEYISSGSPFSLFHHGIISKSSPNENSQMIVPREKFVREVRKSCSVIRKIVSSIYGPNASNALIQRRGGCLFTNDGSTIIRELKSRNKTQSIIEEIIRQAVVKTNQECGDGTTTTAILAISLLEEGLKIIEAGTSPVSLNYFLQKSARKACSKLDEISRPIEDEKDLVQLARIASKGDEDLSVALASACMEVGEEGFVSIEEGNSTKIEVQHKTGMVFPSVPCSYAFLFEGKKPLDGCLVATIQEQLTSFNDVRQLLECASRWKDNPLLIVTTSFVTGGALDTILLNNSKGITNCMVVHIAEGPHNRRETLRDLAALCGSTVVDPIQGTNLQQFQPEWFGTLRKATITKYDTKAIAYTEDAGGNCWIEERIQELNAQIEGLAHSGSVDQIRKRVAQLDDGLCVLEIGGFTESEIRSRFAASEDALNILRTALRGGVVVGGGNALAWIMDDYDPHHHGERLLNYALKQPLKILMGQNQHYGVPAINASEWQGYDCVRGAVRDLWESPKIMTPTEILKKAILNAVSVTGTILLSEQVILK